MENKKLISSMYNINEYIPEGLNKLCGNVQTILITTLVPSIINAVLSITRDQDENFISFILIITLLVISIGLLFYSFYVYKASNNTLNSYFVILFLIYISNSLYILYNYYNNIPISEIYIKTSYITKYSNLLKILLSSIMGFVLLFAFINIDYNLYNNNNNNPNGSIL